MKLNKNKNKLLVWDHFLYKVDNETINRGLLKKSIDTFFDRVVER